MSPENTPDSSAPLEDIGAETSFRFAYQAAWAATLACSLIDEVPEFIELYCEHHEDILLKCIDGSFNAIQVKTRTLSGAAWKADDEEVLKSLNRFIILDATFPNKFIKFIFATNHFFFQVHKNGKNICHLLSEAAKAADLASAPILVKRFVTKIKRTSAYSEEQIFSTLKKSSCTADLPKLKDSKRVLRETISSAYRLAQDAIPSVIDKAANQLAMSMQSASSLEHFDSLPAYLCVLNSPIATEIQARINGKRFNAERVCAILAESLTNFSLLVPAVSDLLKSPAEVKNRLAKKLEAGGFSVVTINLAIDLRAAALHQFLVCREKFGEKEALKRYEHLKTLVLQDCASAHEETKNDQQAFGRKMLESLRLHLAARTAMGVQGTYDFSKEHLEGCAYELTGACKVWWSKPFDLKEDSLNGLL